jgi:murein DD-endopeptidase MepM/ murein hydrolase activator NlpD
MYKHALAFLLILTLVFTTSPVQAQQATPVPGPVYIVQSGDSMYSIAFDFGISLNDLLAANPMTDPNNISAGAQIIIPGLAGISGIVITQTVGYGDSLNSLSRRNQIKDSVLRKLNHITSPFELFAGFKLILPQKENFKPLTGSVVLAPGESLLEAAVRENSDIWTLAQTNGLGGSWDGAPGEILYEPKGSAGSAETAQQGGMPSAFINVTVSTLPMTQGTTNVIKVKTQPGVALGGTLVDKPLHFFPAEDGSFVALQGVFAMLDPGLYPLKLVATLGDGRIQSFEQRVLVKSGNYPNDPMLTVDPETIDPAITVPESQQIATITTPATPDKAWQGIFQLPVDPDYCLKSRFGNRRAYNGGGFDNFHAGLDFGICSPIHPFDIYAPADGVVVFTGKLIVRGNATIIDHGWGIYTGYWHQEEILVNVGDHVKTGQLIGKIGQTGRVTGPHLHWEVWVNGIQVNPTEWLNNSYP